MEIIDAHVHIGKWGEEFYYTENDINDTISVMHKFNINEAICMPARLTENEELLNDIKNHKSEFKFHFACWINPEDKHLDKFLEVHINDIDVFKFHPSFQRMPVTNDKYQKYFRIAEESGKPAIIHCGRWKEVAGYNFGLAIAEKYNRLNVILAHLGGDSPELCIPAAREIGSKNLKNVYLGTESIREINYVRKVVEFAGYQRIIFGSDYNLCLPGVFIPNIEYLDISDSQKEMIFSGTIKSLLNE
jgi:predicted TIM-barrel fold metal-dependent hydrolase